jgi:hypothetical protein
LLPCKTIADPLAFRRPACSLEREKTQTQERNVALRIKQANHIPLIRQTAKLAWRKRLERDCSEPKPTLDPVFQIYLQIDGEPLLGRTSNCLLRSLLHFCAKGFTPNEKGCQELFWSVKTITESRTIHGRFFVVEVNEGGKLF